MFSGLFNASGGVAPGASSLGTAVQVCGTAATARKPCPPWSNGEAHTFTFQVTFPSAAGRDNAYQGTMASASFLWGNL